MPIRDQAEAIFDSWRDKTANELSGPSSSGDTDLEVDPSSRLPSNSGRLHDT